MNIDSISNRTYSGLVVTGLAAEGIRVIRSHGVTLDHPQVWDCKGAGILDYGVDGLTIINPDIRRNGRGVVPDGSGGDTLGSGAIIQGVGTRVIGGYIADNGSVPTDGTVATLEHGWYVSRLAQNCYMEGQVFLRNAASGIKLDGGVVARRQVSAGSPRGVVLGVRVPSGQLAEQYDCDISGTLYAVMAEKGAIMSRFRRDNNRYPKGSRFRLPDGKTVVDLTGWKKVTGLDLHSIETP